MDCNSNFRSDDISSVYISEELVLKQLQDSVKSGLIPDRESGIFLRDGYGALVGVCPANCKTIKDVLKHSTADFRRKMAGKLTIREKIREFINQDLTDNIYFNYKEMVEDGYDLVIGPGCNVHGQQWPRAIYCRNYEEILNQSKSNGRSR